MAVKPITNNQVVNKQNINRGEQRTQTRRNDVNRGNSREVLPTGKDFTKGYSITLKDLDTSIISHVTDVVKPTIREASETIKVPVMYGNEERWKAVRKRGVMRDKKNSLLLPLIMLRRTDIAKNPLSTQGFEHDVFGKYAQVTRASSWSKKNRYDKFAVQTGKNPIYENIVTGMPNFADVTYEFVVWTAYIEQMNNLIEDFIGQSNTYWGSSTDYKFLCSIDSLTDATEMDVSGERIVKTTFSVITKAYLLPQYTKKIVTNKVANMRRIPTISKVKFGYEGDASSGQIDGTTNTNVNSTSVKDTKK